jgi:hypothetical protein
MKHIIYEPKEDKNVLKIFYNTEEELFIIMQTTL